MLKLLRAIIGVVMLTGLAATAQAQDWPAQRWQCAPFARLASGIQIFGNAGTWWNQAEGRYERGNTPEAGAVLVFKAAGKMRVGHVAMVTGIIDSRTITVTHANWSPINGSRGQVEEDVQAVDVSPNNDWTEVRVWYAPIGEIGTSEHPTYGFVYPDQEALQLAWNERNGSTATFQTAAAPRLDDSIGDLIAATSYVIG